MGLIARALEMDGLATTLTSWNPAIRLAAPPRATLTSLNRGATLGEPGNAAQQRRVLEATLALLAQDAPLDIVRLDEEP
ncbi:MAG TPA: hypothetical protein ENK32_02000 [Anaerolineae bacterium]|nr:hypothetical protein [Anaerolineae bacterium]